MVHGHGILQPRVTPSLPIGSESSLFQWAFSGPNGLDPYAFAVSDVYQDLFEEGSFVGKGIYDVDVFEQALQQRIPQNTVLSHDLLEGIFARAALVSDVELVEEFPSRYDVELARQHRWVRGDWQLLPLDLRPRCAAGSIPALGRWKMLDNLRRSLSAPALLLALLVGWRQPLLASVFWTRYPGAYRRSAALVANSVRLFCRVTGVFAARACSKSGRGRHSGRHADPVQRRLSWRGSPICRWTPSLRTLFRLVSQQEKSAGMGDFRAKRL